MRIRRGDLCFDSRATHALTPLPAALASVSYGRELVRVQVRCSHKPFARFATVNRPQGCFAIVYRTRHTPQCPERPLAPCSLLPIMSVIQGQRWLLAKKPDNTEGLGLGRELIFSANRPGISIACSGVLLTRPELPAPAFFPGNFLLRCALYLDLPAIPLLVASHFNGRGPKSTF